MRKLARCFVVAPTPEAYNKQDMLQVLGGMRPMGSDGGTTRQTDSGTAAAPNIELQASDQPRNGATNPANVTYTL